MTAKKKSWRDVIQIHPAAEVFPLMSAEELKELAKDIKANGLKYPVTLWEQEQEGDFPTIFLLDGRNRLDAMELAGIPLLTNDEKPKSAFKVNPIPQKPDANGKYLMSHLAQEQSSAISDFQGPGKSAAATVIRLNITRRHLTPHQKGKAAAAAILADKMFLDDLKNPQVTAPAQPCAAATAPSGSFAKGHAAYNKSLVAEVAEAASIHRNTARKAVKEVEKEMKIKIDAQPDTPELARAKETVLAHPGLSNAALAALADCGKTTVNKARKQLGIASPNVLAPNKPAAGAIKNKKAAPPTGVEKAVSEFAELMTTLHPENLSAEYHKALATIAGEIARFNNENGAKS